jgi:group I intron endonuclease
LVRRYLYEFAFQDRGREFKCGYGVIYKISNNINSKIYIGQTTQNPENRFKQHIHRKKYLIGQSIEKYGHENFNFEIIDFGNSKDDLDYKEIYWIKQLNSLSPYGYNLDMGGAVGLLCEESKKKISDANKGKQPYAKTPEINEKISVGVRSINSQNPNQTSEYKGVGYRSDKNIWRCTVYDKNKIVFKFHNSSEYLCAKMYDFYVFNFTSLNPYVNFPNNVINKEEAIQILLNKTRGKINKLLEVLLNE